MEDRLQKFARVVEIGNITKAAADLHISQPALSTAIHKLERELKTQLIKRTGRTVEITPAGQVAYKTASAIRTKLQDMQQQLAAGRQQKPLLRIGMIDSLAGLLCIHGDLLQKLDAVASTSLTVNNSAYLLQAATHAKLDIAFVAGEARHVNSLTAEDIGSEPLILVTSSNRAGEAKRQLQTGVITDFLAYNPTSNTFRLINRRLAELRLRTQATFHSTSPEVILQLVIAGRGAAALPYQTVSELVEAGTLARLIPETIDRPITILRGEDRQISESIDLCAAYARVALAQLNTATA